MTPKIVITTTPRLDGTIEQSVLYQSFMGIRDETTRWILNTREAGIRQALIDLGWTPPPAQSLCGNGKEKA